MGFFCWPRFEGRRTPQHKLIGYRVSTTVQLKLKDFTKVGPIVEQFAGIDTAGDQTVSYTLEETDAAKVKAVEDAFRRAHLEAHALAPRFVTLQTSDVSAGKPHPEMLEKAMAATGAGPAATRASCSGPSRNGLGSPAAVPSGQERSRPASPRSTSTAEPAPSPRSSAD